MFSAQQLARERLGQQRHSQRMPLEGECKIQDLTFLEFSCLKTILLFPLLLATVVGGLVLKHRKSARAAVFYSQSDHRQATHVFVRGAREWEQSIVAIDRRQNGAFFTYMQLKYELVMGRAIPVGLDWEGCLDGWRDQQQVCRGLKKEEVEQRRCMYGPNEHAVNPPTYFQYCWEVMTEPFFFIQYLAAVIYIIEKLELLAYLLIGGSLATTTINYVLLYFSYQKIKDIAEKTVTVKVVRDGVEQEVQSRDLVPGDIVSLEKQLPCDMFLLSGQLHLNEASLTGQSTPIAKFPLPSNCLPQNSHWLYEGSLVLSCSQDAKAVVVHTGYTSKRGRILRRILHRQGAAPTFFKTFIYSMFIAFAIAVAAYLGTLWLRLGSDMIQRMIIVLNSLLLITFIFPPSCPIYFNLVYSFSLIRLKTNDILGTQPEKTIAGSTLEILCFDKTGTLTQATVESHQALRLESEGPKKLDRTVSSIDRKLLACCHAVKEVDGELQGDEIDLRTFQLSGFKLKHTEEAAFQVQREEQRLQVLKLHQYESRFQSMSVVAKDCRTGQHYVFSKGAPEMIHKHSEVKYDYFEDLIQKKSLLGLRTIGYAWKVLEQGQIQCWVSKNRGDCMKGLTMKGLLAFENSLKPDASETIDLLAQANISSRVITGDNIFIAIQTALRCGILQRGHDLTLLQGHKQSQQDQRISFVAQKLILDGDQATLSQFILSQQEYMNGGYVMVADNDFISMEGVKISSHIMVFARISPENKAVIVRSLKEQLKGDREWGVLERQPGRVGMMGDGANDLLAIREADVGIGVSSCDASYAADFSIQQLIHLDYLVREAKCAEREIIEICRFISINGMIMVPTIIIMETEGVFYSQFQLLFNNATKFLLFPMLIGLSRPAAKPTPHRPAVNFLKSQHQLVFWGSSAIVTLVITATLLYTRAQPEYVRNEVRATVDSGWTMRSWLVSAQFLFNSLYPCILIIGLYEGEPWKEPIYKSLPVFIPLVVNIVYAVAQYFLQPFFTGFFIGLEAFPYRILSILFVIGVVGSVVLLLWNGLVKCMSLHHRPLSPCWPEKDEQLQSKNNIGSSETACEVPQ